MDLADRADLTSLPSGLNVEQLTISGCTNLHELPADLKAWRLHASGSSLRTLPADIRIPYRIDLRDCAQLRSLPAGIKTGSLILRGCTSLASLPEQLECRFIDLTHCTSLAAWPEHGPQSIWRLRLRGCHQISTLPGWLMEVAQLDVSGCVRIARLPDALRVLDWIDIAGTAITSLPGGCSSARIRWRGVPIDRRIAFHPESVTPQEVLAADNLELRRVLLERCGYERFMHEAQAKVLDRDRDAGGERRLLRVGLQGDEDLVCVCVQCPSTRQQYVIRVPPSMTTCRAAVAWIAGFDNPDDYAPVLET